MASGGHAPCTRKFAELIIQPVIPAKAGIQNHFPVDVVARGMSTWYGDHEFRATS